MGFTKHNLVLLLYHDVMRYMVTTRLSLLAFKTHFEVHLPTGRCLEPRDGNKINKPTHQDSWPCGARSIQMVNMMGSPMRSLASPFLESETADGQATGNQRKKKELLYSFGSD